MSNLFNCCVRDPAGSDTKIKMDHPNGHVETDSKSVKINGDNDGHKPVKPNLRIKVPQPIRLRNLEDKQETFDTLHSHLDENTSSDNRCNEKVCLSSVMDIPGRGDIPRSVEEVQQGAEAFLKQYYSSINRENSEAHRLRLAEVIRELKEKGTYQLKSSELVFGAKTAWRNAVRCIGRIQWKKLQVFDCREVTTATGMFEALCTHIKYGTNKGNIRSAITVFPQRTDDKHDFRIWNQQLLSYAGYQQPDGSILGDPANVEFTEVCLKLGWKPPQTQWDILPLVLSADGKDPEFFDIPREIVVEVKFEHPKFPWFKDMDLRWYALPAVSGMRLDCGGLEFTGTAFNGWYMGTEVGCRNLCDKQRLNITEKVALKMGLDTNSLISLWKDQVLVEVNIAVMHSFHRDNVSIVDHHSASEQFLKHIDNETKARGGCPADWVWIVPPMSSSMTGVFHQEMALYFLKPSYEYQVPAWKTYKWTKTDGSKTKRKFHFKQIARAVKFTSKLFGLALSKRIKATILYATETGKSEHYAKELETIFGHAFNAHVQCMSDYDMFSIEHEALLLIVTSTFGNGEPPANGVEFADHLFELLNKENQRLGDLTGDIAPSNFKIPTPRSLMRTNSILTPNIEERKQSLLRLESNKSSTVASSSLEHIDPLSNVRFAVFALGSSAYPKFCNFGKMVDRILGDLGGERIMDLACGDEMLGQEQAFNTWASNIFRAACETFCLEVNDDAGKSSGHLPLSEETVRFSKCSTSHAMEVNLERAYKKNVITCKAKDGYGLGDYTADRATMFVDLEPQSEFKYDPGDHIGIFPCNRKEIVEAVLSRLKDVDNRDKLVQLQVMKEILTPVGAAKSWQNHARIPAVSIRDLFTRYLDITTPVSTAVLKYLAKVCTNDADVEKIQKLINDSESYDEWRYHFFPHLAEVLEQFPSCRPQGSLLAVLLPMLQPRFYSVSSSPLAHPGRIHLTVAVVVYNTQEGKGPKHFGVCSNYLQDLKKDVNVYAFIRRAPSFHMPKDISAPLILIGPGSGIAPFRGFWNHRRCQMKGIGKEVKPGPIWLFFGCRTKGMDLYKEDKEEALKDGVLSKVFLALSREKDIEKKHVQALLEEEGDHISRLLLEEDGHIYVCGDCKMAEEVLVKVKAIITKHANMKEQDVENIIIDLMDENRYHEDIFGITLRTSEIHNASRATAKRIRMESLNSR